MLICAFTAVLANIVRVFIVVYLAFVTEMQHPFVDDHLMLGWYLFGGMAAILLLVDARLSRQNRPGGPAETEVTTFSEHSPQLPVASNKGISSYVVVLLAGALMMALGPAVAYSVNNRTLTDSSLAELELPAGGGGWISQEEKFDDWLPVDHGAENRKSIYQKDGNQIVAYIGYYPVQQQGEELINELNRISNEDIWRKIYTRARIRGDIDHHVLEQLLQKADGSQRLVWYWYNVSGHITVNKDEAKLLQVLGLLTGRHYAYVAAAATDLDETAESARERLRGFVTAIGPSLKK